ncbi:MAG TPA: HIGH nucleotidyl transferase [Ruminococcaceae bacterium]|nr:HIGH nucleotidyl transferase [Oscillospiraceae bacterium]
MKISGIIAEYNPFHAGHAYQIAEIRKQGVTHVAAVMSGHFMQRGDIAVCSKWSRAKAALLNGVDLVIELPVTFSLAPAKRFACGGVYILDAMGCIDQISFSAETPKISLLKSACEAAESEEISMRLREYLAEGMTFAAARSRAAGDLFGTEISEVLQMPNNILAVEYLSALKRLNSHILPFCVRRTAEHDGESESSLNGRQYLSASKIREYLKHGRMDDVRAYMPKSALDCLLEENRLGWMPCDINTLETVLLANLRAMSREEIARLPDVGEGLENRIYAAVRQAISMEQLQQLIKTKRYPLARIRRILLCALIGIKSDELADAPAYIRVLGFNTKGCEILRVMRESARLPIVMKAADAGNLSDKAKNQFAAEALATDIYALSFPEKRPCGLEMTENIIRFI